MRHRKLRGDSSQANQECLYEEVTLERRPKWHKRSRREEIRRKDICPGEKLTVQRPGSRTVLLVQWIVGNGQLEFGPESKLISLVPRAITRLGFLLLEMQRCFLFHHTVNTRAQEPYLFIHFYTLSAWDNVQGLLGTQ